MSSTIFLLVQQNSVSIQIVYMSQYWVKFYYCQMVQYDLSKVYVGETKQDVCLKKTNTSDMAK